MLRTLDMGWEEFKVASEYDGDQHRTDRVQYVRDQRLMPKVARLGWDVIRVIKEDRDAEILDRTYRGLWFGAGGTVSCVRPGGTAGGGRRRYSAMRRACS